MWLSVAAAIVTIVLKVAAAVITGSVGFLSDALESGVNLVAAIVALVALQIASRPADANHQFGHGKAEYVSALVEGAMIFVASAMIIWTSIQRLLDPQPLEQPGIGLVLSITASVVNLVVALVLIRAGKRYRSPTLSADGQHLMTDVWTTVGVIIGIAAVALTGWLWLDPLIALAVGVNILVTGYKLLRSSLSSLLSQALPAKDMAKIEPVVATFQTENGVTVERIRSVESGRERQIALLMRVPASWSVDEATQTADRLDRAINEALPDTQIIVETRPREQASMTPPND
ncbi:cation transporter [Gulosibacter molinativorax]|uniref:Cation transporter n=2 Tax=Gulosibacter molinativorax TaxID=256821 RepID=A0ABT7C3S4_9MICO|nr:cation transporter [Gulosibacter molinativorax]